MKKIYFLLFSLLITTLSFGQVLLEEDFDYGVTPGDLTVVSGGNWVNHSGSTPIAYLSTSLSMGGYPSSGVGGSIFLTSNSEDANRTFTEQTAGTVYMSGLVNISAAGSGSYFFHLKDSGFNYSARVGAMDNGSGQILFGIGATSSSLVYGTTAYDLNTTYLVVASYNIDNGVGNLYVLTAPQATEPATPEATDNGGTGALVSAVAFRQGSGTPTANVDGVRVSTAWAGLTLSTNDFSSKNFNLYPNPATSGYVNITSKSASAISITVFDVLGKQVLSKTINNNRLNVSALKSGIYIMKISQNGASTTKKLVIK